MAVIHPTAIIGDNVEIGRGTSIGAYTVVEPGVVLGEDNEIGTSCHLYRGTQLGHRNRVMHGACLGGEPQDLKYAGEPTRLKLGDDNWIGEHGTLHRGTTASGETIVGNRNFLMSNIHVGHDCRLGDHIVMASGAQLGGGAQLEDHVNVGAIAGVHQFCRIGQRSMVGGLLRVTQDILPFTLVGDGGALVGLNRVGLRRAGYPRESIECLKTAYRSFCVHRLPLKEMLVWLQDQAGEELLDAWQAFLVAGGSRGYARTRVK